MFDKTFANWHNKKYQNYRNLTISLLVLVLAVPPVVVFVGAIINQSGYTISGGTSQTGAVTLVTLFVIVYIWRDLLKGRLKHSLWDEFSHLNGYRKSNDSMNNSVIAGPVVAGGSVAQSSRFYIHGVNDGDNFMVSSTAFGFDLFKTKIKSFKGMSRYSFRYIILAVDIDTELPHIFIDGLKQNRFRYNSTNMWSLNKRLRPQERLIDLEGDFHKYFKVYIANIEHREIAALSIVTPDVMLSMRDEGYNFDYEIYDKTLYVIAEDNIVNIDKFVGFLSAAQAVANELVPQLAKQLHSDSSKKLEINHKKAGWLAAWYSLGVYISYAFLYFVMVGLCAVLGEIAPGIGR